MLQLYILSNENGMMSVPFFFFDVTELFLGDILFPDKRVLLKDANFYMERGTWSVGLSI